MDTKAIHKKLEAIWRQFRKSLQIKRTTFALLTLVVVLTGTVMISKVGASVTLSPDPGPIPTFIRIALEEADSEPRTPTIKSWLSGTSTPSTPNVSVPAGATSVRLRFHGIATVGWRHDNPCCGVPKQSGWVIDSNYQLESASITPVTGGASNAQIGGIAFGTSAARVPLTGFNNTPGYTAHNTLDFDFYTNDSGGFKPGRYSIAFNHKYINHFSPGHYSCIDNGGTERIFYTQDFSRCRIEATQPMELTIELTGGDYNNKATLSKCSGQATNVLPGQVICVVPGMYNAGVIDAPQTWVELDPGGYSSSGSQLSSSQLDSYLGRSGTQPTTGDTRVNGYDYNSGCMANGQCEEHYWWGRATAPAQGRPLWSVQYQPTYLRIEAGTPLGTTLCFRTLVSRESNGSAMHQSDEQCFKVGDGDPTSITSCPAPALPNGNPLIDVSLPDVSPNSPAVPFLPFTTVRNDTYYQDVRQNRTQVVTINDESSGGSRVPPTLVSQSYQTAKINYSPYVNAYPFDNNRPSVTYDSYYDRTTWRSSNTVSFWACPDGWSLENGTGPNCISWYPATQYYTCSYGWSGPQATGYGWLCSRQNSHSANANYSTSYYCSGSLNGPYATGFGWLCKYSNGQWAGPASQRTNVSYSCPHSDDSRSGSTCTHTDWTPANGPYYSCPNGGTATSTGYGMLCRRSQQGTALYNWRTEPIQRNQTTRNTQYNTYAMGPCYNRTYDAYPQAGTATLTPDPESPNQSSFTGQISVNFGTAQNGGQDPMRVGSRINNLPYTISYSILRANGGSGGGGQVSGTVNLAASNNNRSGSDSTSVSHAVTVSVPGSMQVGDRVCWTLYTTSSGGGSRTFGHMDVNGNYVNGTGSGQRSSQSCSPIVINAPYMRVYGGDILAGSGFGVGCAVNNSASIIGWNRGNGAGSAVQFAAQAAGVITDFASAAGRGASPAPPRGLSFANTSGTYGGNFGTGHCAKDYFANATNVQNGYTSTGATITPGARQKIYVDGDAFIRGNIIYTGNGNWGNLSQVPSFYLIARGNIYISEQVTQLDGVYVAQPAANGTGGRIYTCVDHNTRLVMASSPDAYNRCQNQLVVNGSFLARQIRFLRSRGSLRDSSPGEANTSSTIAEVFNYSPELFIVDPELFPAPARQYESATGLPPVL